MRNIWHALLIFHFLIFSDPSKIKCFTWACLAEKLLSYEKDSKMNVLFLFAPSKKNPYLYH